MQFRFQLSVTAFALALLVFSGATGAAALTTHPDQAGTSYFFENLVEDTTTAGDPTPIFGAPTVAGDNLIWTPPSFASNATGGSSDQTNGTFAFDIVSKNKNSIAIKNVILTELGDYSLTGVGTAATDATALAGIFIVITEYNLGGNLVSTALALSDTDAVNFNTPFQAGGWNLGLSVDVQGYLDLFFGGDAYATMVEVVWNNDLATNSELGTTSQIQKKVGIPAITVSVIPEPGTAILMGLGLAALGARRLNHRSHRSA